MLKNIPTALNADVLHALRSMGHGDYIVVADVNFPADSIARGTATGKLLRMDNLTAAEAVEAICSVMPLDRFIDHAAQRMEIDDAPDEISEVHSEVQQAVDHAEGKSWPLSSLERFQFYERAKNAYAVIATGERRFYACFILTKGVIDPDV